MWPLAATQRVEAGAMHLISETMRSRRHLRQSVVQLGESLGSTPGQVASNLAALRVVGMPKHSTDCVIARYLGAIVGTEQAVKTISVSDRSVHVKVVAGRLPLRVRLPRPLCRFILDFDSGCYPDLVDRGTQPRIGPVAAPGTVGPQPAS
jgi:hypothetical protein